LNATSISDGGIRPGHRRQLSVLLIGNEKSTSGKRLKLLCNRLLGQVDAGAGQEKYGHILAWCKIAFSLREIKDTLLVTMSAMTFWVDYSLGCALAKIPWDRK
jgi:hypothetical protein